MGSSLIHAVQYDEEKKRLTVWFTTGKEYVYFQVPKDVYAEFISAESSGSYFHAHIKGKYDYAEVKE
jgi:hypothetical protein